MVIVAGGGRFAQDAHQAQFAINVPMLRAYPAGAPLTLEIFLQRQFLVAHPAMRVRNRIHARSLNLPPKMSVIRTRNISEVHKNIENTAYLDILTLPMESNEMKRLELFSDAVFAIAITLLILDIKVPKHDALPLGQTLLTTLLSQWPSFLAFATSFITILMIWVNHHAIFNLIAKSNHRFVMLNGMLLFLVTFVPFPTALVAEYLGHPGEKTAVLLYTGTFFTISSTFYLLWSHARRNLRVQKPPMTRTLLASLQTLYLWGPILYFVTLLIAFWQAWLSVTLCLGLVLIPQIPHLKKNDPL
jgi:uncharacterized membrane protein